MNHYFTRSQFALRVVIRQKMLLERLFVLLLLVAVSHQSGGGCVSLSVDQLTKKLGNGRANNDFVITTSTISSLSPRNY